MADPLDILKDQRRHLIQRLISHSPMLRFLPGAYREDVCALFNGITPNIPSLIDAPRPNNSSTTAEGRLESLLAADPSPMTILNVSRSVSAKCRKIWQQADEYRHATGQHSLYIGYPLIFTPTEADKFLVAPLFLWSINLSVSSNQVTFDRLKDEELEPVDARFNRIFQAWMSYEKGIKLSWDNGEKEIDLENLQMETMQVLEPWHGCTKTFTTKKIEPLPERKLFEYWVKENKQPVVLGSAVVGHGSFKGQALLDDLDRLEKLLKNDPENCGLLKYFLFPRRSEGDKEAAEPEDTNKWLVTQSDKSQESLIWQSRESRLLILQGPPGTGKSQTIVNLIADALKDRKRVLVVCQKRAALDVVQKRLNGVGLGELVELIDDPIKDRARIIKAIKNIDEDIYPGSAGMYRQYISHGLMFVEKQIDNYTTALNDTYEGSRPRYGDLLAKLNRLKNQGYDLHRNLRAFYDKSKDILEIDNTEELQDRNNAVREFSSVYNRCNYGSNPWRNLRKENVQASDILELNSWLSEIVEVGNEINLENPRLVHKEESAWLAEHAWSSEAYLSFLPSDLREEQERFCKIARTARRLQKYLPSEDIVALVGIARQSDQVVPHFKNYLDNTGWLTDIAHINKKLEEDSVLYFLHALHKNLEQWPYIIEASVAQYWLNEIEKKHETAFAVALQIENLRKFLGELLDKKRRGDQSGLLSQFASRVAPRNQLESRGLLMLRRAGGRHRTPLRRLYQSGFVELHNLRPVLLTNPEAASSILELKPGLYDLVIVDEASQMFMADAIPILYRAKAAVISGDGMQMPPSDFFVSGAVDWDLYEGAYDEDDELYVADKNRLIAAEGEHCLLDAAEYSVQAGSPNKKRLLVHYRSERKELIDFSNAAFYDGELLIPTGNTKLPSFLHSPIVLKELQGKFEDGVNKIEAIEVIKQLKEIWRSSNPPTVGVIAFNVRQRDAIEDLLIEEAQQNDDFMKHLERERNRLSSEGEDVGFFVRSVEHVQGDERDIIIFSTTYDGLRHRNFGPISKREKGRRRLNVAITRARLGIIIMSSLNIDRISNEEERGTSENYYFWKYMCYARAIDREDREQADQILNNLRDNTRTTITHVGATPESAFEAEVGEFLESKGFHVDYQVGESGFRIDIGLKHKKDDRQYICGLECDGRRYHSGWRARLNDIWRQEILVKKGWRIHRIWSNKWFRNPKYVQAELLKKLPPPA